jgi:ferredoxin-NADP reductase/predicted pyridoxine 5'-phosphate oxidase superfamily flavin-nucleotide-binding protein
MDVERREPFHAGELAVQQRYGVQAHVASYSHFIRPFMPDQHREFYSNLPFVVAAVRDADGQPWATVLSGVEGFLRSPDSTTLSFETLPEPNDPARGGVVDGADIGLIGIEFHTRRRNRVNGVVHVRANGESADGGFDLKVQQAYGNCPQHIHQRKWRRQDPAAAAGMVATEVQSDLTPAQMEWVNAADTFFTATGFRGDGESETFGMDASHRGGDPGFVRAVGPSTIEWGDFAGNKHFNTIGNLQLDARAGLVFIDFVRGSLLQVTGRATIEWGRPATERFPGANRVVRVEIERVVVRHRVLPIVWDVDARGRELTVVTVRDECDGIKSFALKHTDGTPLLQFEPGQYLPITIASPGRQPESVERTYSLSGPPGADTYRITVKRESHGVASQALHDLIRSGSTLHATQPRGEFVAPQSERSIIMCAGGVGITPFASMVHSLAGGRRRVVLVHGVRDGAHHPLRDELARVAADSPNVELFTRYSQPRRDDIDGTLHDTHSQQGRIDAALLTELAAGDDADYLVCGPASFMADLVKGLESLGVPPSRIHMESFG